MTQKIFVNLPVKDLQKSMIFFSQLDFNFNPQFTNDKNGCMIIGEDIYVMLITEDLFKTFTHKEICDTLSNAEVILTLSAESRKAVDEKITRVLAAGGTAAQVVQEMDGMYSRDFIDLDGHFWKILYMDPVLLQPQ